MAKGNARADSEIIKESDIRKMKDEDFGSQRVYKKTSPNSVLTLYLGTRDVICRQGVVEPLRGVLFIDPKFAPSHKIYGQLTLTFRYGREDEEVMGLKFCNEAIIALKQIWPSPEEHEEFSPLQEALLERLGKNAFPFCLDVGTLAPPSVQLIPAKRYNGAPIGTSYDVRIHMAGEPDDDQRPNRRCMVKLGVRVIHKVTPESRCTELPCGVGNPSLTMPKTLRLRLSPKALKIASKFTTTTATSNADGGPAAAVAASSAEDSVGGSLLDDEAHSHGSRSRIDVERGRVDGKGAEGSVDKPFLWTEGRVSLRAALNKSAYGHGEHISVTIDVRNNSRKIIRKIRIFAVQHVDVCMFSNGKFKNVVAEINENHLIKPNEIHRKVYSLLPIKGPTKNWIAVEGTPSHTGNDSHMPQYSYKIASSAPRGPLAMDDRNVFAIYVSYYIKVKLTLSAMGGEVVLKLPFILGHVDATVSTASMMSSPPIMEDCTVESCRGGELPDRRDRWATTRSIDQEDASAVTGPHDTCKENDDEDEHTRQQSHSTDDSHRTTSVEDFIEHQESTAAATWKLTTTEECSDLAAEEPIRSLLRRDNVRQSTITTTLARANATEMAVDMIFDEEEHLRRTAHEANGHRSSAAHSYPLAAKNSHEQTTKNSNVNVITAQIHI